VDTVLLQGHGGVGRPLTTVAGAAALLLAATIAFPSHAQARKNSGQTWDFFGYSAYDSEPRYYRPKPRAVKRKPKPAEDGEVTAVEKVAPYKPNGKPLFLMVSLRKQRISVFDSEGRVAEAPISSGRIGFPTPTGVFTVLQKNKVHFSNLYESAPMPNMQRLTWSGVALHAGDLPGYPASHGCIRLPRNFSKQLFDMTKMGTRVVVSRDPVEPVPFAHAQMFRSYPPEEAPPVSAAAPGEDEAKLQTVSAEGTNQGAITGALGISTADAAALPPESPRAAKRKAERLEAEAQLEAAKAKKTALEDSAKAIVAETDVVKLELRTTQTEVVTVQKALAKAAADRDIGDRKLADYYRKYSGTSPLTDAQKTAAVEEEKALEAQALALADGVDRAKAAVEAAQKAVSDAQAKLAAIDQKRREAINALSEANITLRQAGVKIVNMRAAEALRKYPASVYISRKTGKLYVRQNQKPVFEAAVTFSEPDKALGTHVYTAFDYANDSKTELRWNAISIPASAAASKPDGRSRLEKLKAKAQGVPEPIPATRTTPQAALERVAMDESTREQVTDMMKPGSSVIITDHGVSNETGQYTDFIVLTNQ
jgi:lipoprotein-anchoring transpeptidase ErfK/SrfK